jgi:dolichol-phosphate mannosyltransferase
MADLARITTVVPVFNEAESLPHAVAALREALGALPNPYEILVVESGSSDGTAEIADGLAAAHPEVRVLHEAKRNGFGSALRLGFDAAEGELVCVVPADLPYDLTAIGEALEVIAECDAVLSERRHDERSAFRRLQSQVYATLCWLLLGLPRTSPNAAFKMYRRPLVAGMRLDSTGWFIDTEVVYRLRQMNARIRTLKIDVHTRKYGASSVTLADSLRIFGRLVAFRWSVVGEKRNA